MPPEAMKIEHCWNIAINSPSTMDDPEFPKLMVDVADWVITF